MEQNMIQGNRYAFPAGTAFECRTFIFTDYPRSRDVSCEITAPGKKSILTGVSSDVIINGKTAGGYAERSTNQLMTRTVVDRAIECKATDTFDNVDFIMTEIVNVLLTTICRICKHSGLLHVKCLAGGKVTIDKKSCDKFFLASNVLYLTCEDDDS